MKIKKLTELGYDLCEYCRVGEKGKPDLSRCHLYHGIRLCYEAYNNYLKQNGYNEFIFKKNNGRWYENSCEDIELDDDDVFEKTCDRARRKEDE